MTWNSYQSHMLTSLKTSHICCLFCIELCQIVCDPCEIRFMLLWSRSHTLHIYSCWLLHWKLRRNMSSIPTQKRNSITLTWLFIMQKGMGYAREKIYSNPEAKEKKGERKKKKKVSPYLKIKDRVMQKKVQVSSRKIPHTCIFWSDCMTCFLHWIRFLTLQNMLYKYASFPSPTLSSTKKTY